MNITSIKFLKRIQTAQFEHEEVELHAALHEGDNVRIALADLKREAFFALGLDIPTEAVQAAPVEVKLTETVVEKVELKPLGNEPVATANIVKEKAAPRTKKAKETPVETMEGQAIPPVIPQEAASEPSKVVGSVDTANVTHVQSETPKASPSVAGKGIVAYDSSVKEHRSRFATYLGANFPKWTPDAKFGKEVNSPEKAAYAEAVKVFSKNLHGKAFEDSKGNMLESFKAELAAFFGK